jgi:hypothetical protein
MPIPLPTSGPFARPAIVPIAALALLAGCAAQVSDVAQRQPGAARPVEILVAVNASPGRSADTTIARNIATVLQSELVRRLTKTKLTAAPFTPGEVPADADVLHVVITGANPGDRLRRIVIGFGAGRAELRATADFAPVGDASQAPLLTFSTASDSGYKPGLIVPGAVAAGSGNALGLAIGGGVDIVTNIQGGLAKPTEKTAAAIVTRLKKYYASVGWSWPSES